MLNVTLLAFAVAGIAALLVTPFVINLAFRFGAVDHPGERKVHGRTMPRLGGLVIFFSFCVSLAFTWTFRHEAFADLWFAQGQGIAFLVALLAMVALGIWDDLKSLSAGRKFLFQLLISSAVYAAGFRISILSNPFGTPGLELHFLEYAVTVLWLVGITNAVNLIDGLDGLASGISLIACLTIAPIALLTHDPGSAILALILAGALLGFLRYNFNPARIFLGDSGSLGLGFALAMLSVRSSTKASTVFALAIPLLALGLPIMDTLLSMIRRFLRTILSNNVKAGSLRERLKAMFVPDRSHIHHRLIARGLSHRTAVLVMYVVSCLLGAGALAITFSNSAGASYILLAVGIAVVIGIRQLRYNEMAILRNGMLLPLYDREFLNRDTFRGFLDLGFIISSFWIANFLSDGATFGAPFSSGSIESIALVATVQFTVLLLTGLYRETAQHISLRDALRITRSVMLAVPAGYVAMRVMGVSGGAAPPTSVILNFYFLLSAILISRASFNILVHLSKPTPDGSPRVLLYGAGPNGLMVLERVLQGDLRRLTPVGFIDENPLLEGKCVQGYPVYGGHWKIERVLRKFHVDEILFVEDHVLPEIQKRIQKLAQSYGVALRRITMTLETVNHPSGPVLVEESAGK